MQIRIADGRDYLWQWDTGRAVTGDGILQEIHMSTSDYGVAYVVKTTQSEKQWTAFIPDELLQGNAKQLHCYAVALLEDGSYTVEKRSFMIASRPRPAGYVYTPTERLNIQKIQEQIGNLNDLSTANKQTLVDAINEAAQSGGSGGSASGTPAYIYTQGSASDEWTIQHNLGKYPSVTIVDSGGNVVVGDVQYLSTDEISISFAGAFSGKAYLN